MQRRRFTHLAVIASLLLAAAGWSSGPASAKPVDTAMVYSTTFTVSPIINTGVHLHPLPYVEIAVYTRAYTGCVYYNLHTVKECSRGRMYFAPDYLVWGANYSISGLRGVHNCHIPDSGASLYISKLVSCGEHRMSWSYTKQWDQIEICVYTGISCKIVAYHVNMYVSGYISPAYDGLGA